MDDNVAVAEASLREAWRVDHTGEFFANAFPDVAEQAEVKNDCRELLQTRYAKKKPVFKEDISVCMNFCFEKFYRNPDFTFDEELERWTDEPLDTYEFSYNAFPTVAFAAVPGATLDAQKKVTDSMTYVTTTPEQLWIRVLSDQKYKWNRENSREAKENLGVLFFSLLAVLKKAVFVAFAEQSIKRVANPLGQRKVGTEKLESCLSFFLLTGAGLLQRPLIASYTSDNKTHMLNYEGLTLGYQFQSVFAREKTLLTGTATAEDQKARETIRFLKVTFSALWSTLVSCNAVETKSVNFLKQLKGESLRECQDALFRALCSCWLGLTDHKFLSAKFKEPFFVFPEITELFNSQTLWKGNFDRAYYAYVSFCDILAKVINKRATTVAEKRPKKTYGAPLALYALTPYPEPYPNSGVRYTARYGKKTTEAIENALLVFQEACLLAILQTQWVLTLEKGEDWDVFQFPREKRLQLAKHFANSREIVRLNLDANGAGWPCTPFQYFSQSFFSPTRIVRRPILEALESAHQLADDPVDNALPQDDFLPNRGRDRVFLDMPGKRLEHMGETVYDTEAGFTDTIFVLPNEPLLNLRDAAVWGPYAAGQANGITFSAEKMTRAEFFCGIFSVLNKLEENEAANGFSLEEECLKYTPAQRAPFYIAAVTPRTEATNLPGEEIRRNNSRWLESDLFKYDDKEGDYYFVGVAPDFFPYVSSKNPATVSNQALADLVRASDRLATVFVQQFSYLFNKEEGTTFWKLLAAVCRVLHCALLWDARPSLFQHDISASVAQMTYKGLIAIVVGYPAESEKRYAKANEVVALTMSDSERARKAIVEAERKENLQKMEKIHLSREKLRQGFYLFCYRLPYTCQFLLEVLGAPPREPNRSLDFLGSSVVDPDQFAATTLGLFQKTQHELLQGKEKTHAHSCQELAVHFLGVLNTYLVTHPEIALRVNHILDAEGTSKRLPERSKFLDKAVDELAQEFNKCAAGDNFFALYQNGNDFLDMAKAVEEVQGETFPVFLDTYGTLIRNTSVFSESVVRQIEELKAKEAKKEEELKAAELAAARAEVRLKEAELREKNAQIRNLFGRTATEVGEQGKKRKRAIDLSLETPLPTAEEQKKLSRVGDRTRKEDEHPNVIRFQQWFATLDENEKVLLVQAIPEWQEVLRPFVHMNNKLFESTEVLANRFQIPLRVRGKMAYNKSVLSALDGMRLERFEQILAHRAHRKILLNWLTYGRGREGDLMGAYFLLQRLRGGIPVDLDHFLEEAAANDKEYKQLLAYLTGRRVPDESGLRVIDTYNYDQLKKIYDKLKNEEKDPDVAKREEAQRKLALFRIEDAAPFVVRDYPVIDFWPVALAHRVLAKLRGEEDPLEEVKNALTRKLLQILHKSVPESLSPLLKKAIAQRVLQLGSNTDERQIAEAALDLSPLETTLPDRIKRLGQAVIEITKHLGWNVHPTELANYLRDNSVQFFGTSKPFETVVREVIDSLPYGLQRSGGK